MRIRACGYRRRSRRILGLGLCCVMVAATFAPGAFAAGLIDLRGTGPINGDAAAGKSKATVCVACHGERGEVASPLFPSMAGQSEGYLYWQLRAFKERATPESQMTALVQELSDQDMRDLAAYYASLRPASAPETKNVDESLSQRGEALYLHGEPAQGKVPCQGCHGQDARGVGAARPNWPMLRGLSEEYLVDKLGKYRDGKDIDSNQDEVMLGVMQPLTDGDIRALSHWIGSLSSASD